LKGDLLGIHLATNIFIASAILWLLLQKIGNLNPIWAISSMVASVDPQVSLAYKTLRGRIINAVLGGVTGLVVLAIGSTSAWKLPLALAITALLSTYVVKVQVMWRQAPITAAFVIASGLEQHSKLSGMELGIRRLGEVILGCLVGLMVTWLMSIIWPLRVIVKEEIIVKSN